MPLFPKTTNVERKTVVGQMPLPESCHWSDRMGLKQKAAKEVFANFLSKSKLLPDQITFLNQIIDYLVKNGTMDPKALFETPFTNINDAGLAGVFDQETCETVMNLVGRVNQNIVASGDQAKLQRGGGFH